MSSPLHENRDPSPGTTHSVTRGEKKTTEILSHILPCSFCHAVHQADKFLRPQWKHQTPLQLPAHPGSWFDIPQEPNLLLLSSWQSTITAADCPSIHYSCGTSNSCLPKKLAQKCSGAPVTHHSQSPSFPNRWPFSFCPLLSPRLLITTVGQCVICVF